MKLVLVILTLPLFAGVGQAQQSSLNLNCKGTDDATEFSRVLGIIGTANRTLRLPNGVRCVANGATIPGNVTVDNSDGVGITVNTGQTLTILGNIINPSSKQIFFNALPGQGTVSFSGNRYLSVLYPEWWGAKTTNDDAKALNACSTAAATLIAADIDLVSSYNLASTWQVGVGTPFTFISLKGHGAGTRGTTLNWIGAADGIMLKFWANKYAGIERIRFQNQVEVGKTVGIRLAGPGNGTQSNNYNIDNCSINRFFHGIQAGDPETTAAASELSFRNVVFEENGTGFLGASTGNTLVITFLSCGFVHNSAVGIDLGTAGDCHIFGGGFGHNGTDIAGTGWTGTLSVTGVRFEMKNEEVALSIGGVHTVAVRNCTFVADPTEIPKHAIIRGATTLTFENCEVGQPGQAWVVYDFGAGSTGKYYQFVATSNVVRGKLLQIPPDNSAIDGLTTIIDGVKGEVVWPNLVSDTVAGQGRLASGNTPVKLMKRRNTNYSISLASDTDERLHFANKTVDGFDIVSSERTSNSNVTWTVTKN